VIWLRSLALRMMAAVALVRRLPLGHVIGPIQLGMIQTAKELGHRGRKTLMWTVVAFAAAYWWDKLDIDAGYEITLATHKVGQLWADFVIRKTPDSTLMPLFNAPGKPPDRANLTGVASCAASMVW